MVWGRNSEFHHHSQQNAMTCFEGGGTSPSKPDSSSKGARLGWWGSNKHCLGATHKSEVSRKVPKANLPKRYCIQLSSKVEVDPQSGAFRSPWFFLWFRIAWMSVPKTENAQPSMQTWGNIVQYQINKVGLYKYLHVNNTIKQPTFRPLKN